MRMKEWNYQTFLVPTLALSRSGIRVSIFGMHSQPAEFQLPGSLKLLLEVL
ncbi:hypothetical protein D3C86_615850 [compost metagenome]